MPRNSLPWCKRYFREWLSSERRACMNLAERGLYTELVDRLYVEGSIPDDEATLARLVGVPLAEFSQAWEVVRQEFELDPNQPGRLIQAEVLVALDSMDDYVGQQAEKGRKSGRSRKAAAKQQLNSGSTTVQRAVEPRFAERLNQATNHKRREDKSRQEKKDQPPPSPNGERRAHFDTFWDQYPRKIAKRDALKAYQAVVKSAADEKCLSENMPGWAQEFERRDPDKVPYPATFLRKGQWAEPPPKREHNATGVSDRAKRLAREL